LIRFESFERLGMRAAFITERSDGDFRLRDGLGARRTLARRRAALRPYGLPLERLVCLRQVHGAHIAHIQEKHLTGKPLEKARALAPADGMVSNATGVALGILVADCVPIYLFDARLRAAGIVHAGRAGTKLRIALRALAAMSAAFATEPGDVHALIGPSAGPCCYEVPKEMADAFAKEGFAVRGRNIDLWESNAAQLEAGGVPRDQITITGVCTICSGRFHSHRADQSGARNLAAIAL